MEEKTLLVVGRTGNGVTSVVNSALAGSEVIEENPILLVKDKLTVRNTVDGMTIIDGSGIGDCGNDSQTPEETMRKSVTKALEDVGGFDMLIFVLKYGTRFTKQEKDAVKKVKENFGERIFRDRGIIVLSYGDNFSLDNEEVAFEDWCGRQVGEFKLLIEECENRVLLFDNKTKDDKVRSAQRQKLIEMCRIPGKFVDQYTVDNFKNQQQNYKPEMFHLSQEHPSLDERNTRSSCCVMLQAKLRALKFKKCYRIYNMILSSFIIVLLILCLLAIKGIKL